MISKDVLEILECCNPYFKSNVIIFHSLMVNGVFEGEELKYEFEDTDELFHICDFNNKPISEQCKILVSAKQYLLRVG